MRTPKLVPGSSLIGSYQGRSIAILGGARCVWEDLAQVDVDDYMTVNDITMYAPVPITHVWSAHPEKIHEWYWLRRQEYKTLEKNVSFHSPSEIPYRPEYPEHIMRYHWSELPDLRGTSPLSGAAACIMMGYSKIVLCGVPQDGSGYFWQEPDGKSKFANRGADRKDEWDFVLSEFKGRVSSVSGRTKEWLES